MNAEEDTSDPNNIDFVRVFQQNKNIPWDIFVQTLKLQSNVSEGHLIPLRSTLEENVFHWTGEIQTLVTFERMYTLLQYFGDIVHDSDGSKWTLSNVSDLFKNEWFQPVLSGTSAQSVLQNKSAGSFLVRFSTNTPGVFALTMKHANGKDFEHWLINSTQNTQNVREIKLKDNVFPNLEKLVEYHTKVKIDGTSIELKF